MKNLILMSVLAITLTAADPDYSCSQSDWTIRSAGTNLNSVFSLNSLTAWAVGDSGTVLATVDAGSNWICSYSGTTVKLKSVFFIDDYTGWIAGDGGLIMKSADGGESWSGLFTGTSGNLDAVFFANSDTGYAAGPSVTLKTTNGGTTWTSLVSVSGNSLFFTSANVGMATNPTGTLSRTTNGGTSWFTNVMHYPSSRYAISFVNAMTGWVSGSGTSISKTTNGGDNWVSQPTGLGGFPILYGVDFSDPSTGYAAGTSGIILKTTNGGTNWTSLSSGTSFSIKSMSFADDLHGWCAGEKGTILYTTDGGSSWKHQLFQYTPPFVQGYSLSDVELRNSGKGWTVGFLGVVNKTTDGGDTWTSLSTASFNWLYSVDFIDDTDTGYVCGRSGTLQRTGNGGTNWTLLSSGTSQHLNAVYAGKFAGDSLETIMAAGNGGTVLTSVTSGVTIASFTVGTADFYCLFVFDDSDAIVAGAAGAMYKTTDFGSNWTSMTSGTTNDIRSVHFSNSSTGYFCGSGGLISSTTDGGSTWTPQTSGVTTTLNSISFEDIDYENGYAVGDNGVILSTTNFGATWLKESGGSSTSLTSVYALSDYDGPGGPLVSVAGGFSKFLKRISPVALPVELTSFQSEVSGNKVTLKWTTSQEINNSGFEIQRKSNDAWKNIGFVRGNGTTSNQTNYSFEDKGLMPGVYQYRLRQTDVNGHFRYYELENTAEVNAPNHYSLGQNYPNPFNPQTMISFEIPVRAHASLKVYDISGREVSVLLNGITEAGRHEVSFNAAALTSGVYMIVMRSGSFSSSVKALLIK